MNKRAVLLVESLLRKPAQRVVEMSSDEVLSDPKQAYLRLSSQIYNGGLEQLYDNEGQDFGRVRQLFRSAGSFARQSQKWPQAKAMLITMFHAFEDAVQSGWFESDEGGEPPWEQDEDGNDTYLPLCNLLQQIDTELKVDDESAEMGDPFHVDKERHAAVAARREGPDEQVGESKDAPVEAYGVKGMKSTPWRKIFKNRAAMQAWVEKNDAEVRGTREPDDIGKAPAGVQDELLGKVLGKVKENDGGGMSPQQAAMRKLEAQGFQFLNWIPADPDAEGEGSNHLQTAVMAKRGTTRFGREYREVEPDGTIH